VNPDICQYCCRTLRPQRTSKADHPGTIERARKGVCKTCAAAIRSGRLDPERAFDSWRKRMQDMDARRKGGEDAPWHGTLGGYTNHGCRCRACRTANMEAVKARRRERFDKRIDVEGVPYHPDVTHGTTKGSGNYGCRCRP